MNGIIIDTSNWGWPQWILIIISLLALFKEIANNGQIKTTTYSVLNFSIAMALAYWIYIAGGFFK